MKTYPKNFYSYIRILIQAHRFHVIGALLTVTIACVATILSSYTIKILIDRASLLGQDSFSALISPAIVYVILTTAVAAFWRFYDLIFIDLMPKMKSKIIFSFFEYLEEHSYRYFSEHFSGDLATKVIDVARGIEALANLFITVIYSQFVVVCVTALLMFWIHPLFFFILITWTFLFLITSFSLSQRTLSLASVFAQSVSFMVGKIIDSTTNITSVHLFSRKNHEKYLLSKQLEDTSSKDYQVGWATTKLKICQDFFVLILFSSMIAGLLYLYRKGLVTEGDFAFILSTALAVMQGLWSLMNKIVELMKNIGMCQQAFSIIKTPHEIVESPQAKPLKIQEGKIQFKNVSFHYQSGHSIFKDLEVTINPYQKIGLVGFSGSGKSTFAHLILRCFDCKKGAIYIDGQNIKEVTLDSLRSQVAMIPQNSFLFHRSLLENIRYGKIDASNEEVIEASKKAYAHEFIQTFPEGYSSLVGERGVRLSGGQRQRIAIARAILKDAPILILDEATSSLDSITEQQIQESLGSLMKNRTTIVIAHRLSTLLDMDYIFVFDQGKIVEEGKPTDLLKVKGHYAKLWGTQTSGYI